jgi:hypothetical protein
MWQRYDVKAFDNRLVEECCVAGKNVVEKFAGLLKAWSGIGIEFPRNLKKRGFDENPRLRV